MYLGKENAYVVWLSPVGRYKMAVHRAPPYIPVLLALAGGGAGVAGTAHGGSPDWPQLTD